MKKHRILTFLLSFALLLGFVSCLSLTAQAATTASGTCGENLTWTLEDGTLTISGTGDMESSPWTSYKEQITSVVIKSGVTNIRNYAFQSCSLTNVTIPDTVTSIGDYAFYGCNKLTSVTIPNSVTSIGGSAFRSCYKLTSVTIPDSVTSIGNHAFYYCSNLTSVTIPNSVTSIEWCTFEGCSNLTSITIPKGVTSIGQEAFRSCYKLTSVTIPNSVTSIGQKAFSNCESLTSVTIPDSVTSIGQEAFSNCESLTSITIPKGVTSIGEKAFSGCESLTSITIQKGVTSISEGAFSGCKSLTSITIPSSVISIGKDAFRSCTSLKVTIPKNVTSVGPAAFNNCSSLTVAKGNPVYSSVGNCIIETATKTLITACAGSVIPTDGSVTRIGDYAFSGNTMTSSTIPKGVTSIGSYAFTDCDYLTSVTVPSSVTDIGKEAFYSLGKLTEINLPDTAINIHYMAFSKTSFYNNSKNWTDGYLYIGTHLISAENAREYTIKEGTTDIAGGAFWRKYCTEITIPSSVEIIGDNAFTFCDYLTRITIPDSVKIIGDYAFEYCRGLEQATIGNGVTTIGDGAFERCSSLSKVTIGSGVTHIGTEAFHLCNSKVNSRITEVNYNGTVAQWNKIDCGYRNASLYSIKCTDGYSVTPIVDGGNCGKYSWETSKYDDVNWELTGDGTLIISGTGEMKNGSDKADKGGSGLDWTDFGYSVKNVIIEEGVTKIGEYAFQYHYLTSVTIPASVTEIGANAFNSVRNVYYAGTEKDWAKITIGDGNSTLSSNKMHYKSSVLSITTQPKDQSVKADATATFFVKAVGNGMKYQWQYRTSSSGSWKDSGATSATTATFSVKATTDRNGYQYRCKITNGNGQTVYSDTVTLTVTGSCITTQPKTQNVKVDATAKFTVKTTGSGLKYQWQYRTGSSGSWKNSGADSAKTATFSVKATTARNGYQYRCKITDGSGNVEYTKTVTLYVLGVTTQPKSATVANKATANFTVAATGNGVKYQWQYRTSSSGSWKNSGATSATTTAFSVKGTSDRHGYQYRCKITDSAGNTIYSNTVTLKVSAASITTQPVTTTVANNTTAKFTVKTSGSNLSYQWQYRTSSSGSWKNSGATSATTTTFSVKGTADRNGYQYRCKITDANGTAIYSNTVTLKVSAASITTQPKSVTVSEGSTAKFTVKTSGSGLTYQWQYRTSSSGSWKNSGATSATTTSFSVKGTAARNGYQYRCKITDANGNVIYTNTVTLTVK